MGIETLNITNVLADTTVPDEFLCDTETTAQLFGMPGQPVCHKTVYRRRMLGGLEWVEIAGRGFSSFGAIKRNIRAGMRVMNPPRRERRERGGANAHP